MGVYMNQVKIDPVWLMHIQKPARYIGGEWNSVVKNHENTAVKIALAFPDVYEVAMSHLGLKIITASSIKGQMLWRSAFTRRGWIWKRS